MPAPSEYTQTKAEEKAQELAVAKYPVGTRTREQFERSQLKRGLGHKIGLHVPGARKEMMESYKEGKISFRDMRSIEKGVRQKPLERDIQRLTPPEMLKVWEVAKDDEKKILKPIIIKKYYTWTAPLNEKNEIREQFNKVRRWGRALPLPQESRQIQANP